MIRWPDNLTPLARQNLELFRTTSAAAALASDEHDWTLVTWTWVEGPPLHVSVRNEKLEMIDFTMDEDGSWRSFERNDMKLRPQEDGSDASRDHVDREQRREIDEAVPPGMRPGERIHA